MDEHYSPINSPAFSIGATSVATSVSSSRGSSTFRRFSSLFSRRRGTITLKDVDKALRSAIKAQENMQRRRAQAAETLQSWTRNLPEQGDRDLFDKIYEELKVAWEPDLKQKKIMAEILAGIDNMKADEDHRNRLLYKMNDLARDYYKELADGKSPAEATPLLSKHNMVRMQFETAELRYRDISMQLLLKSLRSMLVQADEACSNVGDACRTAHDLLAIHKANYYEVAPETSESMRCGINGLPREPICSPSVPGGCAAPMHEVPYRASECHRTNSSVGSAGGASSNASPNVCSPDRGPVMEDVHAGIDEGMYLSPFGGGGFS